MIKIIAVFTLLMVMVGFISWLERKILGRMQVRHGPMRVGWHGIFQPIADGIKLLTKELVIPAGADKQLFLMAPVISLIFAVTPFAVIPWGSGQGYITDINIGLVLILALSSLGTFGIVIGGWSSNSKYSVLGAMRAVALMLSYELPLILSLVGVVMLTGSFRLTEIVSAQAQQGLWFVAIQPVAFVCYLLAGTAETQRIPFDMLEDEGSLVNGFFTEYSGMGFSLFVMAEYINIILIGAISAVVFLGGWQRPFPSVEFLAFLDVVPAAGWFLLKVFLFVFLVIWFRGTLPRVRYDQLMYFGWKILLPLTLLSILLTGLYKVLDFQHNLIFYYLITFILSLFCVTYCSKHFYQEETTLKEVRVGI